jgi:fructose-1,6-bisphosphatase/sedoheptulose 1,7-bisphosphatase-like protein
MNGVVMILARHRAAKAVKAQLRRRGLRTQSVEQGDINAMARTYFDEHPALIAQTEESVRNDRKLRTLAERIRRKRKRKRS